MKSRAQIVPGYAGDQPHYEITLDHSPRRCFAKLEIIIKETQRRHGHGGFLRQEREKKSEAMPDDERWAVRAKRLYEQDKGDDDEDGEQQIAARRHPGHHGYKHRVQSEHERQQQTEQPLVT